MSNFANTEKLPTFSYSHLFADSKAASWLDGLIVLCFVVVAIGSPIPFGSVNAGPLFLLELTAVVCLILYMLKLVLCSNESELQAFWTVHDFEKDLRRKMPFFVRYPLFAKSVRFFTLGHYPRKYISDIVVEPSPSAVSEVPQYFSLFGYPIKNTGLEIPAVIFFAILFLQLLPLPSLLVKILSPEAAEMYSEAARAIGSNPPGFVSLSLDRFTTASKISEYIAYFLLFWIGIHVFTTRKWILVMSIVLFISAASQSFYGLGEVLAGQGIVPGYQKPSHRDVVSGTFVNSNHFASYVCLILPLMTAFAYKMMTELYAKGSSFSARLSRFFRKQGSLLLLIFGIIVICSIAILLSRSRAGIVIALLVNLIFLFIGGPSRKIFGRTFYWAAAIFIAWSIGVAIGLGPLYKKFGDLPEDIFAARGRLQVWLDTATMFADFPLIGSGAGTYAQVFPKYQTVTLSVFSHAHNDLLEILAETGVMALLVLFILIYHSFQRLSGLRKSARGLRIVQVGAFCSLTAAVLTSMIHFSLQIPAIAATTSLLASIFFADYERKK